MPDNVYRINGSNEEVTLDLNDVSRLSLQKIPVITIVFKDSQTMFIKFDSEERARQEYNSVDSYWRRLKK